MFDKYAKELFKQNMLVLEIGPDKHPSTFNEMVGIKTVNWQTLDIFQDINLTFLAKSAYSFPIADNTFDIVFSSQVIEHVVKPWIWIKELARVCKVGGRVITINPISWPYHEAPCDCWRIYPEGMKALYEEAGLKVELCRMDTLEKVKTRRAVPGTGELTGEARPSLKLLIKKIIGWPTTYPIDAITIGMK